MGRNKKSKRAGEKRNRGRAGGWDSKRGGGERSNYAEIVKENEKFENYYKTQNIVPDEEEFKKFWQSLKDTLPTTWRFTGSKGHAIAVRNTLLQKHIPNLTNQTFEGSSIPAPTPLSWYPDSLAWQLTVGKQVIRRSPPFKKLQAFLVSETASGNISRQEAVSMIPPLLLGVEPHHTVLDMCAAPGSKTAQLIEAIHAGEEERVKEAALKLKDALVVDGDEMPEAKLGRATGLVVANDSDYKRSHLLIHQTKRLNTPNFIVTNQDATIYPSLRLPTVQRTEGKQVQQQYLKFDRVLCDVPCSGDGTARKNPMIWKDWSAANGNGLWSTQARILVRGLQLLKTGGRLVYSTCSLNPIENEAVVHSAIERCGGTDVVEILDVSERLPGLVRKQGLKSWDVMDRDGTWFKQWTDVREKGEPYTDRLTKGMFPPKDQDSQIANQLHRCVRVYPHLQDTGGFFIVVLHKKATIKAAPEAQQTTKTAENAPISSEENGITATANIEVPAASDDTMTSASFVNGIKRVLSAEEEEESAPPASPTKRQKLDETEDPDVDMSIPIETTLQAEEEPKPVAAPRKARASNYNEEPFKFISKDHQVIDTVRKFYELSPHFPTSSFLVRNAEGIPVRTVYYASTLCRQILTENEGRGVRFVHCGVKMFNKQEVQDAEACAWRIQNEGLGIVEAWIGEKRVVRLWDRETLKFFLKEMFPRLDDARECKDQMIRVGAGCCVLRVDFGEEVEKEAGFSERLVLPLWKSKFTGNLMLPKEERKAMLLRLYNDTEGPRDSTKEKREADAKARKDREAKEANGKTEQEEEELKDEEEDEDEDEDYVLDNAD